MPFDKQGRHYLPVFEKQLRLINSRKRFRLASGPRLCGKTLGCCHAVLQHCRSVKNARFCILGNTASQNADGGAWMDLTGPDGVIEQWVNDGLLKWKTKPCIKSDTKKWHCEVEGPNGVADIILDSLPVEREVKSRFFGRKYTGIWVTQMDQVFTTRAPFDVITECLRAGPEVREDQFLFLADVNPPDDGVDSWFYKLWFDFPDSEIPKDIPEIQRKAMEELKTNLEVVTFSIDDNIFVTDARKRVLYSNLCHDQNLLDRFYYGKYVRASATGFFKEVWVPAVHRVGEIAVTKSLDERMLPEKNCHLLITGNDIGSVNPAIVFIEPWDIGIDGDQKWAFKVLDELIIQKTQTPLSDLVEMMMDKMDALEELVRKMNKADKLEGAPKIMWRHFSDTSSFDRYDNIADTFEWREIYRLSEGRIEFEAVDKSHGQINRHVTMIKRLLFQNRLFTDAHCEYVLRMFGNLAPNKHGRMTNTDPDKHAFDALRYAIAGLCYEELQLGDIPTVGPITQPTVLTTSL
jgi:hypothetical protein